MSNSFARWKATRERERRQLASSAYAVRSATTSSAGAAASLRPSAGPGMGRWRIERAGALRGGYGPGWFAYSGALDLDAHGAWFATWHEAMTFVSRQVV